MPKPDEIRKDLFALMVFDHAIGCRAMQRLFHQKPDAFRHKRDAERHDCKRAKVRYPRQWEVDAYLLLGNKIW
jgi:hypothetical protein